MLVIDLYKFEKLNSPIDFNYLKCYAIYRAFNQLEYTLETYLDEDKEDSDIQREIIKQMNKRPKSISNNRENLNRRSENEN